MSTMKAWVFTKSGQPSDILHIRTDWPRPIPTGKQILVKVHAASLNPIGWQTMTTFPLTLLQKKPAVPGSDFSGVVEGGDLEGSGFKVGDEVFGIVPYDDVVAKLGRGTLAEYTLVEPSLLAHKPDNISHAEAASFSLAGLTAYAALLRGGGLKKGAGQRVFINGGSGGVGAYAVQISKAYGAHVVTTCSPASKSLVESLRADELIDYRAVDLIPHLSRTYTGKKQFDIVFDTVGVHSLFYASPAFLKPGAPYVDVAGPLIDGTFYKSTSEVLQALSRVYRPLFLGGTPRQYKFILLPTAKMGPELQEAAKFFADGTFKPVVDEVFKFDDALLAYERSMSGRAKGKVIVSVP